MKPLGIRMWLLLQMLLHRGPVPFSLQELSFSGHWPFPGTHQRDRKAGGEVKLGRGWWLNTMTGPPEALYQPLWVSSNWSPSPPRPRLHSACPTSAV